MDHDGVLEVGPLDIRKQILRLLSGRRVASVLASMRPAGRRGGLVYYAGLIVIVGTRSSRII